MSEGTGPAAAPGKRPRSDQKSQGNNHHHQQQQQQQQPGRKRARQGVPPLRTSKRVPSTQAERAAAARAAAAAIEPWRVTRCGCNPAAARKQQEAEAGKPDFVLGRGLSKSNPSKPEAEYLLVRKEGVYRESKGGVFGLPRREPDYNHFRQSGYFSKDWGFSAGTNDRAVSLSTVDAYNALRRMLPADVRVDDGDLGENIILDGPGFPAGSGGLAVGSVLEFGSADGATIELTEANSPCYRVAHCQWAAAAAKRWPSAGKLWRKDPDCPLSLSGGRGWLARVVKEGVIRPGDLCIVKEPTETVPR